MSITKQTVVIAGVVALSAFYIGRMTNQPPGPLNYNECARDVSKHGTTQDALMAAYSACVSKFGPIPELGSMGTLSADQRS